MELSTKEYLDEKFEDLKTDVKDLGTKFEKCRDRSVNKNTEQDSELAEHDAKIKTLCKAMDKKAESGSVKVLWAIIVVTIGSCIAGGFVLLSDIIQLKF